MTPKNSDVLEDFPNNQKTKVVVVLGMHRSGTSLCMNILNLLGVQMDSDLTPPTEHNERGYFESREIVELNESILRLAGLSWHTILPGVPHDDWIEHAAVIPAKNRLVALLNARKREHPDIWGFKDPRLCLLLPLYEQVFRICHIEPLYVLCMRNPGSIALSLERRDGFPHMLSELLWMEYSLKALHGVRECLKAVVQYEAWFDRPLEQMCHLANQLELQQNSNSGLAQAEIEQVIAPALNHGRAAIGCFALGHTQSIYRFLQEGKYEAAGREYLDVQRSLRLGLYPAINKCQLFWRTLERDFFNEVDSCSVHTDMLPVPRVVRLPLPTEIEGFTGLRLDPADLPGVAHFLSMRILNSVGGLVWGWGGEPEIPIEWEIVNMTLRQPAGGLGILAQYHNHDPMLMLPIGQEQLGEVSQTGGVLEFEFAWLTSDHRESCHD